MAIDSDTTIYTCSVCDLIFCFECTHISEDLHAALIANPETNFKWTCNACKQNFPSMNNIKTSFQLLDSKNEARMTSLEEKIDNIQINVASKVKEQVTDMKKEVVQEITEQIMGKLSNEVRMEVKELEEQKIRIMNIMVFNMPESNKITRETKKEDDCEKFLSICTNIGVVNIEIKQAFRIGVVKEGACRPLKVIFDNKKTRKDILDNAKHIRQSAVPSLKKVIFAKDMTWRQRESNRARVRDKYGPRPRPDRTDQSTSNNTGETTVAGGIPQQPMDGVAAGGATPLNL
ncbi:MAG: hypothetical protein ABW185_27800 [Sedimenticola sp.]